MSFVKTKWRIIELSETAQIDSTAKESYKSSTLGIYFISPKDIIQSGLTVRELCDEFVCDERLLTKYGNFGSTCTKLLEQCKTIYGAVWTPEGLKYVAKMNENGEFELL